MHGFFSCWRSVLISDSNASSLLVASFLSSSAMESITPGALRSIPIEKKYYIRIHKFWMFTQKTESALDHSAHFHRKLSNILQIRKATTRKRKRHLPPCPGSSMVTDGAGPIKVALATPSRAMGEPFTETMLSPCLGALMDGVEGKRGSNLADGVCGTPECAKQINKL